MRCSWPILFIVIVLALGGAIVSLNLTIKHQSSEKASGLAWFDEACEATEDEESNRSCDQVMASKWGYLPPLDEEKPGERQLEPVHIAGPVYVRPRPSALLGFFYFSAMAAWYLGVGRTTYDRRYYHLVPLLLNVVGVGMAVFFIVIMFSGLDAWCPWCMVTHAINFLMLIGAVLLWPRRPAVSPALAQGAARQQQADSAATGDDVDQSAPDTPVAPDSSGPSGEAGLSRPRPHPGTRLVLVTLGAMLAVVLAEEYFNNAITAVTKAKQLAKQVVSCRKQIKAVEDDAQILYSLYRNATKHDIPRHEDDATFNDGPNRLSVVVFSDFQCPHCGKFAKKLNDEIAPLFNGHLRITFKHYPASKRCNPYLKNLKKDFHPLACFGSLGAEAARLLGGNEAFFKAHDLLFESQKRLGKKEFYIEIAEKLGLDPDEFTETMDSDEAKKRILADIELAKKLGVKSTPSVFISGRQVPRLAVQQMHFWQVIQRSFQKALRSRQQQAAQAREKAKQQTPAEQSTPDSPNP